MAKMNTCVAAVIAAGIAMAAQAVTVVDVSGTGVEKTKVSVEVEGSAAFKKTLERNLFLSGAFKLATPKHASIRVTGQVGGKIVAQGRLAAGELKQRLPAAADNLANCGSAFLRRQVGFFRAAVGKAISAVQIAAFCKLQQGAAGADLMLGADAAGLRAVQPRFRRKRRRLQQPLLKVHFSLPDGDTEKAVLRTGLFQKDPPVIPSGKLRGDIFQADGTD